MTLIQLYIASIGLFIINSFQVMTLVNHIRRKRSRTLGIIMCLYLTVGTAGTFVLDNAMKMEWFPSKMVGVLTIAYSLGVLVLLGFSSREQHKDPGINSVVEAFESMNMGLCYYDENGRIILCNEYMHGLSEKAFHTRVLNGREFRFALTDKLDEGEDRSAFELSIGSDFFYVTIREIKMEEELVTELKCVDVTQLHEKREKLTENNQKLQEINEHLISYGEIADTVIREQEILNAKIRVHDTFGDLLLTSKRAIEQKVSAEEMNLLTENLKSTLQYMRNDGLGDVDYYGELQKTAESIGVTIHLTGALPTEDTRRDIVLVAIRECLTNTVKHGNGNNLFVEIKNGSRIRLWNDGSTPEYPIHLGTGLSSLAEKVRKSGGTMTVSEQGSFSLELVI